jgi:hypothetical protein
MRLTDEGPAAVRALEARKLDACRREADQDFVPTDRGTGTSVWVFEPVAAAKAGQERRGQAASASVARFRPEFFDA